MRFRLILPALLCALLLSGCAGRGPTPGDAGPRLTPEQTEQNLAAFDQVWETIRDKHWQTEPGGADWTAVREELRPRAAGAATMAEAREVLQEMLGRLGQSHFAIFPSDVYAAAVADEDIPADDGGSAGLRLNVIDGKALVTGLHPDASAAAAGVAPGWELLRIRELDVAPLLERLSEEMGDETSLGLIQARSLIARTGGAIGDTVSMRFLDAAGDSVSRRIVLREARGELSRFGNLPAERIWWEKRVLDGGIGYFAFNMFLDLTRVMPAYNEAMQDFMAAPGVIVDLRGNPGGLGAMAMGMSGWFFAERGQVLGVMSMRTGDIKYTINPRPEPFTGPVAVLIDEGSASTSEIMAGGLKDLGRARVFGNVSAGAALPSYIEKLPNGDGFQYAVANYVSHNGRPLEGLGVTPHETIVPTRAQLLRGEDPVLQAAVAWIQSQSGTEE